MSQVRNRAGDRRFLARATQRLGVGSIFFFAGPVVAITPRRPRSTHPPVGVTSGIGTARALCDGARLHPVGCSPLSLRATGDPLATPPAVARHGEKVFFADEGSRIAAGVTGRRER